MCLVHLRWGCVRGVGGSGGVRRVLVDVEQAGVCGVRVSGHAGAHRSLGRVEQAGDRPQGHLGELHILGVQAGVRGVLGGGSAGGVGDAVRTAARSHGALHWGVWSGLVIVQGGI